MSCTLRYYLDDQCFTLFRKLASARCMLHSSTFGLIFFYFLSSGVQLPSLFDVQVLCLSLFDRLYQDVDGIIGIVIVVINNVSVQWVLSQYLVDCWCLVDLLSYVSVYFLVQFIFLDCLNYSYSLICFFILIFSFSFNFQVFEYFLCNPLVYSSIGLV